MCLVDEYASAVLNETVFTLNFEGTLFGQVTFRSITLGRPLLPEFLC
jgi:hypothetical protein